MSKRWRAKLDSDRSKKWSAAEGGTTSAEPLPDRVWVVDDVPSTRFPPHGADVEADGTRGIVRILG